MGGGDLNAKKSWHPNTMKNQERVWKAEQAAADEKKRILELQRERAEEKDRAELNDMAKRNFGSTSTSNDDRLHWMYDKPDKKVQQEDYLLGKAIDASYDQQEKAEQDIIPAVARRVVGSSMLTSAGDTQVDLARKIREDPLVLVKERERAARAALLNNPLQRRRLTELLRKEQEQKAAKKVKKKPKKKEKELDKKLAAKLNALGNNKDIDIAALLASDDSSDSSSSEDERKSKKKKKQKKGKKKSKKKEKGRSNNSSNSDTETEPKLESKKHKSSSSTKYKSHKDKSRKRKTESDNSDDERTTKKHKSNFDRRDIGRKYTHDSTTKSTASTKPSFSEHYYKRSESENSRKHKKREGLSEEERAARLATMAEAGLEREQQRERRVAEQRAADALAETMPSRLPRVGARNEARSIPDSLESRIHSNRHYIQRDRRHMNEHFAKR